ncbi:MAG: hypothetical protein ACTTKI_06755 [Tannerella sp.]|uniref:hypothetical protein n=1 Tax=Tannerella sp. TaxID=2382127 RepID=UPI003FA1BF62
MTDKQHTNTPETLDYYALRKMGMKHIAQLGGSLWSDHNIHDPGITVLELLCFALTDLKRRTSIDMRNILTEKGEKHPNIESSFHKVERILPSHPITIHDYKKLIIDKVPGVRNVLFKTTTQKYDMPPKNEGNPEKIEIHGFYDIFLELEDFSILKEYQYIIGRDAKGQFVDTQIFREKYREFYSYYVQNFLLKHRNLCEDINRIYILEPVEFWICVDIEIESDTKYEKIINEVFLRIHEYINPSIKRYTLGELLEKGKTVEEIYQGVLPENGFIENDELEHLSGRKTIHSSDIINVIMNIEGVVGIKHFQFMQKEGGVNDENKYQLTLSNENEYFFFDPTNIENKNRITITKGLLTFVPKVTISQQKANKHANNKQYNPTDSLIPTSHYYGIDEYVSIQGDFPFVYKLGHNQLGLNDTDLRKAQRNQLKAYLLFFEQLLADYLMHLFSVKDLFSWKDIDYTYFTKELSNKEIADFSTVFQTDNYAEYQELVGKLNFEDRRNRLLNHLIARFNEDFVDYSALNFLMKKEVGKSDFSMNELIKDKVAFLKIYDKISTERSKSIDYKTEVNSINASSLEKRIYAKLGLKTEYINRNYLSPRILFEDDKIIKFRDNSSDSYNTDFGVHVYEHILFRPRKKYLEYKPEEFLNFYSEDTPNHRQKDPYSMQVTVVAPGWLKISSDMNFREFVEKIVRMEIPAHIAVKICWISPKQMHLLEKTYEKLLNLLPIDPFLEESEQKEREQEFESILIEWNNIFNSLRNIFPQTMHLSSSEQNYNEESIVLDSSTIDSEDLFTFIK